MTEWIIDKTNKSVAGELIAYIRVCLQKDEPIKVTAKRFSKRSLDQNALFHVWCEQYASHLTKQDLNTLNYEHRNKLIDEMKISAKRKYYAQTGNKYVLEQKKDLFTGKEHTFAKSTRDYDKSEMNHYMEWLQNIAAEDGLILESKGEYESMKLEQNK